MISAAMLVSISTLDCRIWPSNPMVEVTSETPIATPESVAYLNNSGSIRIWFERAGNELRDVNVVTLSDPMGLDERKQIRWRGTLLEGDRIHLTVSGQAKNNFRWIILDPAAVAKFTARWRVSEPLGSGVILAGSGFGECVSNDSGGNRQ